MGDADWLKETGLNWGWDDNYPDFKEKPSNAERWKTRSGANDIEDNRLIAAMAHELARISEKKRSLEQAEAHIRERLQEKMPFTSFVKVKGDGLTKDYLVEHSKYSQPHILNTRMTLHLIKERHGSEEAALVAAQCMRKSARKSAIFVRPFPKQD